MPENTLDGPTLRAFTIPSAVHDTISNNGSSGHSSHVSKLSPSTPSTLPSPFVPERPRDTLLQSTINTISSAVRISSFNAPDLDLHVPLTLAVRRHGAALPLGQNAPGIHPSVNGPVHCTSLATLRISTPVHYSHSLHAIAVHPSPQSSYLLTLTTLTPTLLANQSHNLSHP
ncbi:uncharacterized protein FOMMEDRAFT_164199 [Fomitiporia mediterranea MF3/22]|uniref:Uncharacterized protein n=1 Tax=Fomitiporia mediterranea (strain MF3/22) TaxID=694068 RepID=R7SG75_FOMME|nr:uncharacterized protein FOMMEDRAFT_164199 [Fomitiporia mediterranea MF3/22]EJC97272.1 hypothetical protein FOMMEDRAFT_164199 [Fomitiporia mediterranea MF3/22]